MPNASAKPSTKPLNPGINVSIAAINLAPTSAKRTDKDGIGFIAVITAPIEVTIPSALIPSKDLKESTISPKNSNIASIVGVTSRDLKESAPKVYSPSATPRIKLAKGFNVIPIALNISSNKFISLIVSRIEVAKFPMYAVVANMPSPTGSINLITSHIAPTKDLNNMTPISTIANKPLNVSWILLAKGSPILKYSTKSLKPIVHLINMTPVIGGKISLNALEIGSMTDFRTLNASAKAVMSLSRPFPFFHVSSVMFLASAILFK